MSYATIVTSSPSGARSARRQTVVIPNGSDPIVYSRISNGGRGASNAWMKSFNVTHNDQFKNENTIGLPIALEITQIDQDAIASGVTPSNLLQRLARMSATQFTITQEKLTDVIAVVMDMALNDPDSFGSFVGNQNVRPSNTHKAPVIDVVQTPAISNDHDVMVQPAQVASLKTWSIDDPIIDGYIPRSVYGQSVVHILDTARSNKENVAIFGHAGVGKTSEVIHYSAQRALPLAIVDCNGQIDKSITEGGYVPDGRGGLVFRYSALATAIQQPSVVFLNEATRMSAKANAFFLALLQERQLVITTHQNEIIHVHPECLFVSDQNVGYRGVSLSDQAFLDRFNIKIEFMYDTEIEKHFIPSASLLELARELRRMNEIEQKFQTPISTRLLKNFVSTAKSLSYEFAVNNFLNNFSVDERDALRMLLDTYSTSIASELGVDATVTSSVN